ncbi:MAG: RDD family protein [Caldilineaceae bacterium]|nr:RDD family protein [Caldilineaceae bacterium]HRJ45152.1 RDD family protein [Caldilineaceae bacterium]
MPPHRLASLRRRIASYTLEIWLLFAGVLLLQGLILLLGLNPLANALAEGEAFSKRLYHLWLAGTVDLPLLLYYSVTLASPRQATLVMRWLNLRTTRTDGSPLRLGHAILRSLVMLIPFEINHIFLVWFSSPEGVPTQLVAQYVIVFGLSGLYILAAGRSPLRQSIHDRIAGTIIVHASA